MKTFKVKHFLNILVMKQLKYTVKLFLKMDQLNQEGINF